MSAGNSKAERLSKAPGRPFQKGVSGNPGGRPKSVKEVTDLAQQHSPEAIQRLVEWMRSDDARASVTACNALLDRGHGKPTQRNEHTGADGGPIQTQQVEDTRTPIDELIAGALAKTAQDKETRH